MSIPPPKDTPITVTELAKHDGSDPSLPIYVAIKGDIFDVSAKSEVYGKGAGYNVFTGKDASKALGKSSLKIEDCVPDTSDLTPKEQETLEQWYAFFSKRYPIIGKVVQDQ
ncbi:hypothetical protein DFQ28_001782 [Apophysomyces sp. BC1034]|nr:hypothetical protein DFQ30_011316 [Apophysomyces sp. BC1015]KAG0180090.1 hypothetical protein DFQ29_001233 [Apophysomyces sp. BC1021]KAG0190612.1 hypothetical protein DFQ28_001782 [Apophysomyces sp. BC1034]